MITQKDLGRSIELARKRAGLSQPELSRLIGIHRSALSRIESGERKVDSIELAVIANVLGVTERSLLSTEESQVLYLRAAEAGNDEVNNQIMWVNQFLDNYEFLKELG